MDSEGNPALRSWREGRPAVGTGEAGGRSGEGVRAFANLVYCEVGEETGDAEYEALEEIYDEVPCREASYMDMERPCKEDRAIYENVTTSSSEAKDYYEYYDFGENGIYQNILFRKEPSDTPESRPSSERSPPSTKHWESPILEQWALARADPDPTDQPATKQLRAKAPVKTLFTSTERKLVSKFIKNIQNEMNIHTAIMK
jgi:hypothetical protein